MATLEIRKKATKTWFHYPSDQKDYAVSKMYCKFNGDYFRVVEQGGRQRGEYHFSDITVFDDSTGGGAETFTNPIAVMLRLEDLEYVGFELGSDGSGGVGFQPQIITPQNGQVILYQDGIWHNGFLDLQGDRFLQTVPIPPLDENTITIPIGFIWTINSVVYSLLNEWIDTIPYASDDNLIRKDIIVAIAANNFIRIAGEESTTPSTPPIPPNSLLVTTLDVYHDSIGEPELPIIGSQFIPKLSESWTTIMLNPSILNSTPTIWDKFGLAFAAYTSGHVIRGLNIAPGNEAIWSGATLFLRCATGNPVTLQHATNGFGKLRFWFPDGNDFLLSQDKGVLMFKAGVIPETGQGMLYYIGGISSSSSIEEWNDERLYQEGDIVYYGTQPNIGIYVSITNGNVGFQPDIATDDWILISDVSSIGFIQRTGTSIVFDKWATYGTYAVPVSGDLSYSFSNMVAGMIQVLYHQSSSAPTILQSGVIVIESGDYVVDNVNKITVHCIANNVVEIIIKAL